MLIRDVLLSVIRTNSLLTLFFPPEYNPQGKI